MKQLPLVLVLMLLAALLFLAVWGVGCSSRPQAMTEPPGGKGWQAYHQSYHFHSVTSTSQQQGNYQVTRTESQSRHKLLEGSFMKSHEQPSCAGVPWIRDCKLALPGQGVGQ